MAHICKWKIGQVALILATSWSIGGAVGTDNAHFYKPPSMYGSSPSCWFEHKGKHDTRKCDVKDWLSKFDFSYTGGQTHSRWNHEGHSSNILNIHGPTSLLRLGAGVPAPDNGIQDTLFFDLESLANQPPSNDYGLISFNGKFELNEFDVTWRQNFVKGFFFEGALPVRNLKIKDVHVKNVPVSDTPGANYTGTLVSTYLHALTDNNFAGLNTLIEEFELEPLTSGYSRTGVGDLSLHLGWEDIFKWGHFPMGFTFKAGVVAPTGENASPNHVFSLPLGYHQNVGINGYMQWDIAFIKWLTFRAHGDVTYFCTSRMKTMRLKTAEEHNSWLNLASGKARERDGVLWHLGGDFSFDHFVGGLSARVGYSFTQQEKNKLKLIYNSPFDSGIANSDQRLAMWNQHTIHTMLDYDLSVHFKKSCWAPRLAGFYNVPVAGRNVFKTQTYGGTLGLDIRWNI